jgi:hypothetical protein
MLVPRLPRRYVDEVTWITPMAADVPRQHHYTPQVLLTGFTHDGTKTGSLQIVDLVRLTTYSSVPEKTGTERNYNLVEGEGLDPFAIESDLLAKHIEAPVGPAFQKLRRGELPSSGEEQMALLNFVAMQAIRSPNRRDAHDRRTTDIMRQIIALATVSEEAFAKYQNTYPELAELTREDAINIAAHSTMEWGPTGHLRASLPSFGRIYDVLEQRSWCLLIAPADVHFVCTDDPVVFVPIGPKPPDLPRGFRDPDPVLMPIGKSHALFGMFPPPNVEPVWVTANIDAAEVAKMNSCLLDVATRFVASPADDFTWMSSNHEIRNRANFVELIKRTQNEGGG